MKRLWKYFKGYGKECVLGPLFKLLEASFELMIPLVVKKIIDEGIPSGDQSLILRNVGIMVLLGVVGMSCSITAQYFSAKAAVGFSARVKQAVFSHIQHLSHTEIDRLGTSTMITRLTSDINTLQGGVNMSLRLFLRSPFIVFGAVVMAFTIDTKTALCFVATVAALSVVVYGIMLITIPMHRNVQSRLDTVLAKTRSNLIGVRVIRAFGQEEKEKKDFNDANAALVKLQILAGRISALLNPLTFVLVNAGTIWVIRSGALAVDSGKLTQGAVVALINYMAQILVELIKLANMIVQLTRALACAGRISSVLETESSMQEGEKALPWDGKPCGITLRNVSLTYADGSAPAVEGVDLKITPGSTVGIIGGTGSGKSSLIRLIPRFYDASSGEVFVDGTDVREYTYDSLRSRIAIVPQKSVLFSGTVRSNLAVGKKEATDAQMLEALKNAQALSFVEEKEGLDTKVSQGGKNFSGGQRQRLAIARALVRHPGILILDDSTSALDYATDAALRKTIRELPDAPTTIIVSQRAASILHADQILVLDGGAVAGLGTHEELLQTCEVYKEIYESQFPPESKQ